jgi:IclR helix-turn-helix domain
MSSFPRARVLSMRGRPRGAGECKGPRSPASTPKLAGITLTLSGVQVTHVLREITGSSGSRGRLLGNVDDLRIAVDAALANAELDSQNVSFSGLRMLSVLCAFTPDGSERGLLEVAVDRGLSPSTTHRYMQTLIEVGLLEQASHGSKYRIPPLADESVTED